MTIASTLYGTATSWRRRWYDRDPARRRRLRQPVISVGNLAVGGSGKTPVVAYLARLLLAQGERPSVLSRGYGRPTARDGVTVVSDGHTVVASFDTAGDEPLMLARGLPGVAVVVGADRHLAGRLAEEQLGATVHLLDDGFQHLQLARDVDLLLLSDTDLGDVPLPSGRLREPLPAASAADAVLVNAVDGAAAEQIGQAAGVATAFRLDRQMGAPVPLPGARRYEPPISRVVAVAAIAGPERFFGDLSARGLNVVHTMTFRDHHVFTRRDVERIAAAARQHDAVVITTEKDGVRLAVHDLRDVAVAVAPLTVTIEPADAFAAWLAGRLRTRAPSIS